MGWLVALSGHTALMLLFRDSDSGEHQGLHVLRGTPCKQDMALASAFMLFAAIHRPVLWEFLEKAAEVPRRIFSQLKPEQVCFLDRPSPSDSRFPGLTTDVI